MLPCRAALALLALLAACAAPPPAAMPPGGDEPSPLEPLPATFRNTPSCAGCLAITLTLRPDGGYLLREELGASAFYDFGRWRALPGGMLELSGGGELRRYRLRAPHTLEAWADTQGGDLVRAAELEPLRGPFRLLGLFDDGRFRECMTGTIWRLADTRAAQALQAEARRRASGPLLVSLDAAIEARDGLEVLVVQRTASILNERGCPG